MTKDKVLVVDDNRMNRWTLVEALGGWGYSVTEAETVAGAISAYDAERPAAVLLDINLPDGSGLDVLCRIKRESPEAVVIMITGQVLADDIIAALRGGAYDFIAKPINLDELEITVRNAIEAGRLREEITSVRRERSRQFSFEQIVGVSPAIREVLTLARKVATSEAASAVLLQGESGTGKDLIAKAMHYASVRAAAPFVAINCAALPANLIESELFGYEKGAFTDAKARKEGLFELATGGIFWTRSANSTSACRRNFCACWKKAFSGMSADSKISRSTRASSPLPTAIYRRKAATKDSASIYFIVCR